MYIFIIIIITCQILLVKGTMKKHNSFWHMNVFFHAAFIESDKISLICQFERRIYMFNDENVKSNCKTMNAHTWQCTYLIVRCIFVAFLSRKRRLCEDIRREDSGSLKKVDRQHTEKSICNNNCTRYVFSTHYNKIVHTSQKIVAIIFLITTRESENAEQFGRGAIDCDLKLPPISILRFSKSK